MNIMFSFMTLGLTLLFLPPSADALDYESYFNYIEIYPYEAETNYAEDVRGITHDDNNWFISQIHGLWKIPVELGLASSGVSCNTNGVMCADLSIISGYNIGDIDHYQYTPTIGYLLLPLSGGPHPAMAIFNSTTLEYITHMELPAAATSASWVAVDPQGYTYLLVDNSTSLVHKYLINWNLLTQSGILNIQKVGEFDISVLGNSRGGVFSKSGHLLYYTIGGTSSHCYPYTYEGLYAFNMQTQQTIAYASKDSSDPFYLNFDISCNIICNECEQPMGLTIWDLDDERAPNVSGQLHVIIWDEDTGVTGDDIYIWHYTNKIFVDGSVTGPGRGKPYDPYNTVDLANSNAWDGAEITITSDNYPETVEVDKQVELTNHTSISGSVVIGNN